MSRLHRTPQSDPPSSKTPLQLVKPAAPQSQPQTSRRSNSILTEEEEARRQLILQRIDPKGYGLLSPANFEGDDLYLLLAPAERGKTEPSSFRIPPELKQAAEYLIGTQTTPFKNYSEFMKSAVVLLLRTIADLGRGDSAWRNAVRTINMGIARSQMVRRRNDIKIFLESNEATIREALSEGDVEEARELMSRVRAEIEALDDGPWREKGRIWLEKMDEVFESIREGADRVAEILKTLKMKKNKKSKEAGDGGSKGGDGAGEEAGRGAGKAGSQAGGRGRGKGKAGRSR